MKIGDKVVSFHDQWGRTTGYTVYTIERETKRHWITNDGSKWNKETLRRTGEDSWTFTYIREITPEIEQRMSDIKEKLRKDRALNEIQRLRAVTLSADRLEEILAELKGEQTQQQAA